MDEGFDPREIFLDRDVQQIFDAGARRLRLEDLSDADRELLTGFLNADGEAERLKSEEAIIRACVAGVRAFEHLSDPMPGSWAAGWKKFVLYMTALNSQFLWDRHHRAGETAIFADWVVFSIEQGGWGPDGNASALGRQHTYCQAVGAAAGGGVQLNPVTGQYEAPDGSAARNYDPALRPQTPPALGPQAEQSASDYRSLFADAGITDPSAQDRCSRFIDAAVEQGALKSDELAGVGEGPSGLYVVGRRAVLRLREVGVFKRRIEAEPVCPIGSITELDGSDIPPSDASVKFEGRTLTKLQLTAKDADGRVVLQLEWSSDSERNERQRQHLAKVIIEAIGRFRPSS